MEKYITNKLITNQAKEIVRFIVRAVTGVEANQILMKEYLFICNTTNGITTQLEYGLFKTLFYSRGKYGMMEFIPQKSSNIRAS